VRAAADNSSDVQIMNAGAPDPVNTEMRRANTDGFAAERECAAVSSGSHSFCSMPIERLYSLGTKN